MICGTDPGDLIGIDTYYCDSIYLLSKNRFPVNRFTLFLPWYMDAFESEVVEDINKKKPKVVIYNEDMDTWGIYSHYSDGYTAALRKHYTRLSEAKEDGWKYHVWILDK